MAWTTFWMGWKLCTVYILSSLSAMPHIGNMYLPAAAEYENNKLYLLNINQCY